MRSAPLLAASWRARKSLAAFPSRSPSMGLSWAKAIFKVSWDLGMGSDVGRASRRCNTARGSPPTARQVLSRTGAPGRFRGKVPPTKEVPHRKIDALLHICHAVGLRRHCALELACQLDRAQGRSAALAN